MLLGSDLLSALPIAADQEVHARNQTFSTNQSCPAEQGKRRQTVKILPDAALDTTDLHKLISLICPSAAKNNIFTSHDRKHPTLLLHLSPCPLKHAPASCSLLACFLLPAFYFLPSHCAPTCPDSCPRLICKPQIGLFSHLLRHVT